MVSMRDATFGPFGGLSLSFQSSDEDQEPEEEPDDDAEDEPESLRPPVQPHSLTEECLVQIFNLLPFRDLLACREVCSSWTRALNDTESFLTSTVLLLTLGPFNSTLLSLTKVPWQNLRFQLEDDTALDNLPILPTVYWAEFSRCRLSWRTVGRTLSRLPSLEHVSLYRSGFRDSPTLDLSTIPAFSLVDLEMSDLGSALDILNMASTRIERIEVVHNGTDRMSTDGAGDVLKILGILLARAALTLRHLVLDFRAPDLLNLVTPVVFVRLEPFLPILKLETFQVTPPRSEPNTVISYESPRALLALGDMFNGNPGLTSVGWPHLSVLGPYETRRWTMAEQVSRTVQVLRVPGPLYLRRNFLKSFTNLKELFIGEKTCPGPQGLLNPIKFLYDYRGGIVKGNCRKVRRLGVFSKVNYESGKLYHVIEKFPLLTEFTFDGFKAILDDKDVQALIKYTSGLKRISITHTDLITDAGLTGMSKEVCNNLHRLSTVYEDGLEPKKIPNGRPISDLKGLESLILIGSSPMVTDVGLKFGLKFLGLRTLQLPWSPRITEWGLGQVGSHNPSLESLSLAGASPSSMIGLTGILRAHPRLLQSKCHVHSLKEDDEESYFPSLLTGILWGS